MSQQNLSSSLMRMKAMLPGSVPVVNNSITPSSNNHNVDRKSPDTQIFEACKKEQNKTEDSIHTLTNSLSTTVNSVKTIAKKQNDLSSVSSSLQKKVKELQSSCVTTEHKMQKENSKIDFIHCRLNQIEKQIKTIDKKLEQGGRQGDLVEVLREELSQMEISIMEAVKHALREVDETRSQIRNFASDFKKLRNQMLDLLVVTGTEKTSQVGDAFLIKLVRDQLSMLTYDVTKAYEDCMAKIEKDYTHDKKEIKRLKDTLKSEQQRNNRLDSRVTKLENSLKKFLNQEQPKQKKTKNVQQSELTKKERRKISKKIKKEEKAKLAKMEGPTVSLCPAEEKRPIHLGGVPSVVSETNSSDSNLSYFQKAQIYLLNQVEGNLHGASSMGENSNLFAATVVNKDSIISEPVLQGSPIEWAIRKKRDSTVVESLQHGSIMYTKTPGYRIQFRAQLDQLHGDIYFSIRVLKGVFDEQLKWPLTGQFKIQVLHKSSKTNKQSEIWMLPSASCGLWEKEMLRPAGKKSRVYSEWVGPFDISHYLEREFFYLLIELV